MDSVIELIRPDGSSERYRIDGEQITIGRSSAAGISLPAFDALEQEHVMIMPRGNGCWVAVAKGATLPVYVSGRVFENGTLPWGSQFVIGELVFRLVDVKAEEAAKGKKGVSPVVFIAALVPILAIVLFGKQQGGLSSTAAEPPALFAQQVRCSDAGDAAVQRARSAAESGFAYADRYVFALEDGVRAADLFALAAACYDVAGKPQDAQRIRGERSVLVQRIDEDYRGYQLRLEQAIRESDYPDALDQADALTALTKHVPCDYTRWLEELRRELQSIIAEAAAAAEAQQ